MAHQVDPLRITVPVFGARREQVQAECRHLEESLRALDAELDRIARQRREAARQLKERRHRLWPNLSKRGRRPLPEGRRALPPISSDAVGLWGRRLRARCREILRTHRGAMTLTEIHAMMHRQGYFIDSGHVVKALSDAMRYDVSCGKVRRVARGTYTLTAMGAG